MSSLRSTLLAGAVLPLALAACGSSDADSTATPANTLPPGADAKIDPANFVRRVDNPWYPLRPGSTYRYRGAKDGRPAVEVLKVTGRTKTILGVTNVVIDDRLFLDDKLREKTEDWYAQDRAGNVWYFGESTATLKANGQVESRDGSFQAGVDGARPGIYMPAHPAVGQSFQQEYYTGHAEDRFTVSGLSAAAKVPYGSSRQSLRTTERTPLEPKVVDAKYYVRGVGTVKETQLEGPGPREVLELVSFKRG